MWMAGVCWESWGQSRPLPMEDRGVGTSLMVRPQLPCPLGCPEEAGLRCHLEEPIQVSGAARGSQSTLLPLW